MKWAVIHHVHTTVPHRHVAKLFIEDVPEDVSVNELNALLTRAGYSYGEFGIPWANHYLAREDGWVDEVWDQYNRKQALIIKHADIAPREEERKAFLLRLPMSLYRKLMEEAKKRGVTATSLAISAIDAYLSDREGEPF